MRLGARAAKCLCVEACGTSERRQGLRGSGKKKAWRCGTVSDCGLRTLLTILREPVRLDMVGNVVRWGKSDAAQVLEAFGMKRTRCAWEKR